MPTARSERKSLDGVRTATDATVDEHRNASVHGLEDFGERFDGRLQRFHGAAAVVGNDDAVDAMFDRQFGILAGFQAFEQELHFRGFLHAIHEVPGHRGAVHLEAGHIETFEHRAGGQVGTRSPVMAFRTFALIGAAGAVIGFRVASAEQIDGQRKRRASGRFYALDDVLGLFPFCGRIELIPDWATPSFGEFLRTRRK